MESGSFPDEGTNIKVAGHILMDVVVKSVKIFRPVKEGNGEQVRKKLNKMLIEESKQDGKKTVCNVILIDASGSMDSKVRQVISDLKELFNGIRTNNDVNHHTIVCDFSGANDFRVLVNSTNKEDLKDSVAEKYATRGSTALRDAIAKAFTLVPEGMDGVYVNILTDGHDNVSETTVETTKKLIDAKNEAKWGITFMGTTQASIMEAQRMGIDPSNTMMFADNTRGIKASTSARKKSMMAYTSNVMVSASMDAVSNTGLMDGVNEQPSIATIVTTTNTNPLSGKKDKKS